MRYEQARDTVRISGVIAPPEFGPWLDWAYGRLSALLDSAGVTPDGPAGALYGAEIVDDGLEQVEAFFPVASPFAISDLQREISLGEVPAAWVAVLVHTGDYESIDASYRALGAWVARNADHAGERVREWYLVGPSDVDDPKEYRTEIAWPITQTIELTGGT
ncbi:MAG: GyrI-like domain-containing protein [Egibacteraceae bacterium]